MSDWAKFYVDAVQPGIVRGGPFDSMGGMLVGLHAKEVCNRLNTYGELKATIEREAAANRIKELEAQLANDVTGREWVQLLKRSKELEATIERVEALQRQIHGDDTSFFIWAHELDAALKQPNQFPTCKPHGKFPCRECGVKHFEGCQCAFCREQP